MILGTKWILVMEFSQFIYYHERESFIKKFYKKCGPETSSRLFYVFVELSATYNGKFNVWNKLSFEAELSKYVKIGMKTSGVTLL